MSIKTWRWTLNSTVVSALIGAATALGVQLVSVNATNLSTRQLATQSCIQRIDTQEAKLREVMERLFGSLGALIGESISGQKAMEAASKEVMKQAFEVNAYAPPELALGALTVAMVVHQGMTATSGAEQEAAISSALNYTKLLPQTYRQQLGEFDTLREACRNH